jgi:hypothetical protein
LKFRLQVFHAVKDSEIAGAVGGYPVACPVVWSWVAMD